MNINSIQPLDVSDVTLLCDALRQATDDELIMLCRGAVRVPITIAARHAVCGSLLVPLSRHATLSNRTYVELLGAAQSVLLPVVRQRLRSVCLCELNKPCEAEERGSPPLPWSEPRNHCSARILASLTPPETASSLRLQLERQTDRVVRFWLAFGVLRATGDISLFTQHLTAVQPDDFGTCNDDGWGANFGSLSGAYDLLQHDCRVNLDAVLRESEVGRFVLASAAKNRSAREVIVTTKECTVEGVLSRDAADEIGQAWLSQIPWLDRHDPEPYQFLPNKLQNMERKLAGTVVTHILRSRIGYDNPEGGEYFMDGGQATAMAIDPLGDFEPDFRGLFEVFSDEGGEGATSYQAAAAAAYSDDVRTLLEHIGDALRSPSSSRRGHVGRFLEFYMRYHGEGRNIPTWGGGGEPDDVLPGHDLVGKESASIARLSSQVHGPTAAVPGQTFELQFELSLDPSGALLITDLAEGWDSVTLTAIASSTGAICVQSIGTLVIDRNAGGGSVAFEFRVPPDYEEESSTIRVVFLHQSRYCGSVLHVLGVRPKDAPRDEVILGLHANDPDVTVTVFRIGKDNLAWHTSLSRSMQAALGPHQLQLVASTTATGNAATFFDNTYSALAETRKDLWCDAVLLFGRRIAELAPQGLCQLFSMLRAQIGTFSVQFISDECDIPWELMTVDDSNGECLPLGVACSVARWSCKHEGWMGNHLNRSPFLTMAPQYDNDPLPQAEAEAADLEAIGAVRIRPADTREFISAIRNLSETGGILHFAGHGSCNRASPICSEIFLSDGAFSAMAFEAAARDGLSNTLVILNACEAGDGRRALGVFGGWVQSAQRSRCGAFIAPVWSADDELAREFVVGVLRAAINEGIPLSEAVRDVRAHQWTQGDNALAYVLYGDVTARIA